MPLYTSKAHITRRSLGYNLSRPAMVITSGMSITACCPSWTRLAVHAGNATAITERRRLLVSEMTKKLHFGIKRFNKDDNINLTKNYSFLFLRFTI